MRIRFELRNAGHGSHDENVACREATRMAMLCWCLRDLGHDAYIHWDVPKPFQPRLPFFEHLMDSHESNDVVVLPCRADVKRRRGVLTVGFKTTVNTSRDEQFVSQCDILIAHEYAKMIRNSPKLMPVSFPVHDRVLEWMLAEGMVTRYLQNDVETFREMFCKPTHQVGFIGYCGYGRKQMALQMREAIESTVGIEDSLSLEGFKFEWYETPPYSAVEYLQRIGEFRAGFCYPGDTHKSNRWSELCLLGIPCIHVKGGTRLDPPIDSRNSILLDSWGDIESLERGLGSLDAIRAEQDAAYCDSWSIQGQARILSERLLG